MKEIVKYLKKANLPYTPLDEPTKDREILSIRSIPVPPWNKKILHPFIKHMERVMKKSGGIGLAAIQIGIPLRLFIVEGFRVVINPVITSKEGFHLVNERCLSLDKEYLVGRYMIISAKWRDQEFKNYNVRLVSPLSIIFQHEYDHLDGLTLEDREWKR